MQKRRDIVTGIDIGTHSVRVVQAEWNREEALPKIVGTGIAESRGLRHGYIINTHDAAESIRTACAKSEKISGIKIKRAFISAGGIGLEGVTTVGSTMVALADGEVTDRDVKEAEKAGESAARDIQNRKVIHVIPISYRLDGKEVLGRPQGMKGQKLEVKLLLITALAQHINDTILSVETAGVEVEDIFASPLAAAYVTATRHQKTAGCVLANIGAETVSIVVFENNIPISLKVFPIGSTNITNDIALGLKVSLDEAEHIKLGETALDTRFPKKKLEDIISSRLSDIFDLIEAHLKKIDRNELLPAGVIITGGGSGMSFIADFAKTSLKLPSRIGYPAFGTDPNTAGGSDVASKSEIRNIPAWTVAYGLCILGFSSEKEEKTTAFMKGFGEKAKDFFEKFLP